MGRIRTIKPEFPQSESIGRLSRDARLLFIQLWTIVDDSGVSRGASRILASLLYPFDDDAVSGIEAWIEELEREGMVVRYQSEGTTYIQIMNWLKHQKIDKPSPSRLPQFASPREDSRKVAAVPRTMDLGPIPPKSACEADELKKFESGLKKFGGEGSASLHVFAEELLADGGWEVVREYPVADRGDGRRGKVDLVATKKFPDGSLSWAIELDWKTPREKSLHKLQQIDATRIVVLREGQADSKVPNGFCLINIKPALGQQSIQKIQPGLSPPTPHHAYQESAETLGFCAQCGFSKDHESHREAA
jgi:hypothetical protein